MDVVDKWLVQRWTKFTSSEIHKLLNGGSKPGDIFGAGAMTYIKKKALEMSTVVEEKYELDEVEACLHGKVYERPAYEWYINTTRDFTMHHMGSESPIFLDYEPLLGESGGSPDALSLRDDATVKKFAEIKCPKNSMYHFDRLVWVSQWDLKEKYLSCYAQMQHLFMITKAESADFVSFDDRQARKEKKGKIIEVFPDKKFQDNLDIRIRLAIKEKYRIYEKHMTS